MARARQAVQSADVQDPGHGALDDATDDLADAESRALLVEDIVESEG
jgi:hypothetical protein